MQNTFFLLHSTLIKKRHWFCLSITNSFVVKEFEFVIDQTNSRNNWISTLTFEEFQCWHRSSHSCHLSITNWTQSSNQCLYNFNWKSQSDDNFTFIIINTYIDFKKIFNKLGLICSKFFLFYLLYILSLWVGGSPPHLGQSIPSQKLWVQNFRWAANIANI